MFQNSNGVPPAGGGAMPPRAPAPAQPSAQQGHPDLRGLPPHVVSKHVNTGNSVQMELLKRVNTLSPEEAQALKSGIAPQAVAVLRRLLPEVAFLLDMLGRGAPGAPGAMPPQQGAGQPPMPAPAQPPAPQGGAMQPPFGQPKTRLGSL